jgi:pyridoxamine 5'-phosphate oxidase
MTARQRASCCSGSRTRRIVFTNYESRKGRELAIHPDAALLFHWIELERQVRIEGTASKVAGAESDAYFASRPGSSRLCARAWPPFQTRPAPDWLEPGFAAVAVRYEGDSAAVPRPPFWGGYRVVPSLVEFWQGRPSRLHDRIVYRRDGPRWQIERLAP